MKSLQVRVLDSADATVNQASDPIDLQNMMAATFVVTGEGANDLIFDANIQASNAIPPAGRSTIDGWRPPETSWATVDHQTLAVPASVILGASTAVRFMRVTTSYTSGGAGTVSIDAFANGVN